MRICRSGREKVTNEEESGDNDIHVGTDFDLNRSVKTSKEKHDTAYHLFKFVQVRLALEGPQSMGIYWEFERIRWLPILDKPAFISRNNAVVSITILEA